jgi:hypothetical protein
VGCGSPVATSRIIDRGAVFRAVRSGAPVLLDHLVGSDEQSLRNGEAERFGGLEIDHWLECCRLLYRKFAWFFTA